MADAPNLWSPGDEPLPDDVDTLVAQIKNRAAARQRMARMHPLRECNCDGCYIRRGCQRVAVKTDPVEDDPAEDAA